MNIVVLASIVLLDTHIGQMYVHVLQLSDTGIVFDGAEATESQLEEIDLQGTKGSDQDVQTEVEFFATNQQRIRYVSGDDITFLAHLRMEGLRLPRPLFQLRQLIDQEDSSALRLSTRLHYPRALWILAVLLHKHVVVRGQDECDRNKVQMKVLIVDFLRQRISISFQVLSVSLDILYKKVLARQFVVIGKVVDYSVGEREGEGDYVISYGKIIFPLTDCRSSGNHCR